MGFIFKRDRNSRHVCKMKTGADNVPVFLLPYNRSKIIDSVWKIRFIHHDSLTHTGGTVMQPFKNKEELQENLSILWDRIFTTPEILSAVTGAKLVARFRYTDFPLTLYIDIKNDPPRFYFNPPGDDDFDVEMILSSETSHHFWMQELNVPLAIASRKIVAKGSIQKALKLLPALKPAFAMYPGVLRDTGRHDLLLKQGRTKIRKKKYFSFGNRKARYNPSLVPAFPDCGTKITVEEIKILFVDGSFYLGSMGISPKVETGHTESSWCNEYISKWKKISDNKGLMFSLHGAARPASDTNLVEYYFNMIVDDADPGMDFRGSITKPK